MSLQIEQDPAPLGARLKAARGWKRLTQQDAAGALGIAPTTIVAIEGGRRVVTRDELRQLAELYEVGEGELLSEDGPKLRLRVDFRWNARDDGAGDEASAALLHCLAVAAVQLEALVGQRPRKLDLPAVRLRPSASIAQQAEDAALALRLRLGIGLGPSEALTASMELALGLRAFERPLPSGIAGAVALDENAGGFVLLNSRHAPERRRVTAGRAIGRLLLGKPGLSVLYDDSETVGREQCFQDLFGIALLAPAAAVRREATDDVSPAPAVLPRSLVLACIAHQRELLSEQQIASMLELDVVTVRQALQGALGALE